jgi:hypothetical protein
MIPPSAPPPTAEAGATVFHAAPMPNAPPKVCHFVGTINLGFAVPKSKRSNSNISILLKRLMAFDKQTNPNVCIEPLNRSDKCITNPSNVTTSKEGIELYYQHRVIADSIRCKINIIMTHTMGEMKDPTTPFREYLNQDKVYVLPAVPGLVDTCIIVIMLQTDPQLTFRDVIEASITDIMSDNTPLSVFAKQVRDLKTSADNPHFTNGLVIQVTIKDDKETEACT